jgi:hypothetical protein
LNLKKRSMADIEERQKIAIIEPENQEEEEGEEGNAQDQERRGDEGHPDFSSGKKLDDKKTQDAQQGGEEPVERRQVEGEPAKKREGDFLVDVEVSEKKRKEAGEKKPADEGVGQDFDEFH